MNEAPMIVLLLVAEALMVVPLAVLVFGRRAR